MLQRLIDKLSMRKRLKGDGNKCYVQYSVIVNNENIQYFNDYNDAVDFIARFRSSNQIFNLSVFRVEFYSLVSDVTTY